MKPRITLRLILLSAPLVLAACEGATTDANTAGAPVPAAAQPRLGVDARMAKKADRLVAGSQVTGTGISLPNMGINIVTGPPAELTRRTGLPAASVEMVGANGGRQVAMFRRAGLPAALVDAVPARLCGSIGKKVAGVERPPTAHPSNLPGVEQVYVRCR